MTPSYTRYLRLPLFADADTSILAGQLNILLLVTQPIVWFLLAYFLFFQLATPHSLMSLTFIFLTDIVGLVLIRLGYVRTTAYALFAAIWAFITLALIPNRTLDVVGTMAYAIIIIVAGLLTGWRASFLFVCLSSLVGLSMGYQSPGRILAIGDVSLWVSHGWVFMTILYSITAVLVTLAHHQLRLALLHTRHKEQILAESNQQLQTRAQELALAHQTREALITELSHKNKELERFNHTVSHDLRSPLAMIIGFTELLSHELTDYPSDIVQNSLHHIHNVSYKMSGIIEDILLLSRLSHEVAMQQPVDMGQIVQEALLHLPTDNQTKIILPHTWQPALGYAPWLEIVWVNYLSNGQKYGGNPPILTLGSDLLSDNQARFWIKDNGAGIDPELQQQLFTEFTRLGHHLKPGNGLGLSIVRRIITQLGGQVGIESQVGQGSTFYFTLPADLHHTPGNNR